jgi:hypothetical protein
MTRFRYFLIGVALVASIILAFFLRDVIYHLVIVPLAYLYWLARFYYTAVPQVLLWTVLLFILILTSLPNFVPEWRSSRRREEKRKRMRGQIEALAEWMVRGRRGTYFKWQIANRLGRIARGWGNMSEQRGDLMLFAPAREGEGSGNEAVERYLEAGLNTSFADYPRPKRFQHSVPTPLDLDPQEAIAYLESQMELSRGRHP